MMKMALQSLAGYCLLIQRSMWKLEKNGFLNHWSSTHNFMLHIWMVG